jgi:hypothetical protein
VRVFTLIALAAVAGPAAADRLITIPTGSKIPYRTLVGEYVFEKSRSRTVEAYLGLGIGKSFDMELRSERIDEEEQIGTFDIGYNYIAPIRGFGPGLSVGVQDVANRSRDGRRAYFAATFLEGTPSNQVGDTPASLTIGYMGGSINAAFVGVMMPFTDTLRLLAEHNGRRITAGFEFRPKPWAGIRLLFRDRDTLLGASVTTHF